MVQRLRALARNQAVPDSIPTADKLANNYVTQLKLNQSPCAPESTFGRRPQRRLQRSLEALNQRRASMRVQYEKVPPGRSDQVMERSEAEVPVKMRNWCCTFSTSKISLEIGGVEPNLMISH
ncbi:hypothetical protein EVAR_81034_1 [Eumeta japonica]|uniref:Uncharacterized protein n=1 Tax=Eumeta variegata TaxID=151549 RepID=A0A4C1T5G2_EUMVA|nr:hypothetical protein EVAR_81034_1 [Eumeta japonica]